MGAAGGIRRGVVIPLCARPAFLPPPPLSFPVPPPLAPRPMFLARHRHVALCPGHRLLTAPGRFSARSSIPFPCLCCRWGFHARAGTAVQPATPPKKPKNAPQAMEGGVYRGLGWTGWGNIPLRLSQNPLPARQRHRRRGRGEGGEGQVHSPLHVIASCSLPCPPPAFLRACPW